MNLPKETAELLEAYFAGDPTPETIEAMEAWLREDPANPRLLAEYGLVDRLISHEQKNLDASAIFAGLLEPDEIPHDQLMSLITQVEAKGEDLDPMALAAERFPTPASENPTKQQVFSALTYVMHQAYTPKRVAALATAAALLLGVVLAIVLLSGPGADEPTAEVPDWPDETTPNLRPPASPTLAKITDTVDAQWRWGDVAVDLPIGSQLREWDRLTLTAGFAQITTQRGAEVLLQAPCTIEMTSSDSAIRLHQGKLVGKCLTPDSKGLVVHAPGMDIVDLGTEFGIEADAVNGSTVLVMDGLVRAQPTAESPRAFKPVVLTKAQARRIKSETGALEMIAVSKAPVFYEQVPHPYVRAVLDAKPVAYWRFEDDEDNKIVNEVEPGRGDLEAFGAAATSDEGMLGRAGRVLNHEGRDDYFNTPQPVSSLNGVGAFTMECWFYVPDRGSSQSVMGLYSLTPEGGARIIAQLELQGPIPHPSGGEAYSIRLHQQENNGIDGTDMFAIDPYETKRWYHFVLTMKDSVYTLYLDGQEQARLDAINELDGTTSLAFGHSPMFVVNEDDRAKSMYRPLRGLIDEAAVYPRALSQEEIASHWSIGKADLGGRNP